MERTQAQHFDILIVGGGPAGSTAAALLARAGWRVLLAEKDRHPRFHIGESLLPANIALLEELGVLEQVRRIGVLKLGADFPGKQGHHTFRFDRALGDSAGFAFQVRRDQFDELLFRHAATCGADARQALEITQVRIDGDRVLASARQDDGGMLEIQARYLVDASGRDTLLGKAFGLKRKNPRHQSAAIFGHFSGVARRQGEEAGNISIYRFDHGWSWFIPLPDGLMSIGAVCMPEHLKRRREPPHAFLMNTLGSIPEASQRLEHAKLENEIRVTGNYSYTARAMAGRRWIMAGDAYAFIDPIFSSGVYLAMHSARHAADVVDGALRAPEREAALQRAFARRIRRGLKAFSWFIYRFNSPTMQALFADPRGHLQIDRGVIAMLAGDVFDNKRVRRRLTLFKAVYAVTALLDPRRHLTNLRLRRRQARIPFDGGTTAQDRG